MKNTIFVPGEVASSKNGRTFARGRSLPSKSCQKYYKASKSFWEDTANRDWFLSCLKGKSIPYRIEFTFIRGSKRRFDLINPLQTVQDLMVKSGWLVDDNADILLPSFGLYKYEKGGAGVWITVL